MYSGGSKTELEKPNAIPIPNVLMFWFRMVPFLNGWSESKCSDLEIQLASTILKDEIFYSFIQNNLG